MNKENVVYVYIYIYVCMYTPCYNVYNTHTLYTHTNTHIHTHTLEYYLAIKNEWNNASYSKMDGTTDYHTKWSKRRINTT